MPIEFTCPGCQKTLRVADAAAGKQARCPDCGQIGFVPESMGFSSSGDHVEGATWSTGDWAPNESVPETGNPFASPHEYAQMGNYVSQDIPAKVAGPAIGLIVMGILNLCLSLFQFAFMTLGVALPNVLGVNQGMPAPDELLGMVIMVGIVFVALARDAFIVYGALQMKNLKSYPMALTAAIISIVPCNSICCFLYLPMAIWALVILCDSEVKYAFRNVQEN